MGPSVQFHLVSSGEVSAKRGYLPSAPDISVPHMEQDYEAYRGVSLLYLPHMYAPKVCLDTLS